MQDEKLLFTFGEVSRMTEINESMVVRKGQVEGVRIARAMRVPRQSLLRPFGTVNPGEVKQ